MIAAGASATTGMAKLATCTPTLLAYADGLVDRVARAGPCRRRTSCRCRGAGRSGSSRRPPSARVSVSWRIGSPYVPWMRRPTIHQSDTPRVRTAMRRGRAQHRDRTRRARDTRRRRARARGRCTTKSSERRVDAADGQDHEREQRRVAPPAAPHRAHRQPDQPRQPGPREEQHRDPGGERELVRREHVDERAARSRRRATTPSMRNSHRAPSAAASEIEPSQRRCATQSGMPTWSVSQKNGPIGNR